MYLFKNNPKINLYYTDTDSIYTDSDIDESFIHNKELVNILFPKFNSKTFQIFLDRVLLNLIIFFKGIIAK
jgi:hypothetical protein